MKDFQMVFVHSLSYEAPGILSIDLRPIAGTNFITFDPGSHIDLYLPNNLVRSYSLLNDPSDNGRYVIAVLNDKNTTGGSAYIHNSMKIGDVLKVSLPHNNFPLYEQATHTVLVAGGIGIVPIYCMLNYLVRQNRAVELIYCARSRSEAIRLAELEKLNTKITYHFDDEQNELPNLQKYLVGHTAETHFYCCGPMSMSRSFAEVCKKLNYVNTHVELFSIHNLTTDDTIAFQDHVAMPINSNEIVDVLQ